jgi:hypothetical protein
MPTSNGPSDSNVKWHKKAVTNPLMSSGTLAERTEFYRRVLESDVQGRLVVAANRARAKLIGYLGQPVWLLTPPSGSFTKIPGEYRSRLLRGEKGFEGADVKVCKEYDGKWTEAKDLARCTLVVRGASDIKRAWNFLILHFAANTPQFRLVPVSFDDPLGVNAVKSDFRYHSAKETLPGSNPCGYSGYTVCVQSGDFIGEIQVNCVPMMYSKSEPEFIEAFGEDEVRKTGTEYPSVPGFKGHQLYEVYREQKDRDKARAAAAAAANKAYYDYFRSDPPDYILGQRARAKLVEVGILPRPPKAPPRYDKSASSLDELLGPEAPDGPARAVDIKPGNFKQLFGE